MVVVVLAGLVLVLCRRRLAWARLSWLCRLAAPGVITQPGVLWVVVSMVVLVVACICVACGRLPAIPGVFALGRGCRGWRLAMVVFCLWCRWWCGLGRAWCLWLFRRLAAPCLVIVVVVW